MNLFDIYTARINSVVSRLVVAGVLPAGLDLSRLVVEPPRDASHGDLATNAAMVLAKAAGMNPRALAELLVVGIRQEQGVVSAEIAGPGFINLKLEPDQWHQVLRMATQLGEDFGCQPVASHVRTNVEYVSANPTGPMHVGHGRGAVFGDALANLLSFAGHDVTREYYINDAGAQVDVLARSAFLRYREALGEEIGAIPEGLYPGDYLVPVGAALAKAHGSTLNQMPESEWLPLVRQVAIDGMMAMIREDLAALGVEHNVFFSERSLQYVEDSSQTGGAVAAALLNLRNRSLIYEGRLPPPKGQVDEEWEDREQTLFRSTQFGDDVDRPLLKSDGGFTYFASDIAYHKSKFDRGFADMIDIWGADHGGYVKRMQAAVTAITGGQGALDVKLCQMVRLLRNGEPVKMSKRSGDFVTLREVIDEVGRDAVRFMMIFRKNDATLDFDLAKVVEQSKDNPVFYVQYAHARCCSVERQARDAFPDMELDGDTLAASDMSILSDEAELGLMKLIAQYPRLIEQASVAHEPHRVAFYAHELASTLHSLWNRGKDMPHLRFINPNDRLSTLARLALVHSTRCVLASALAIAGVSAPQEMR